MPSIRTCCRPVLCRRLPCDPLVATLRHDGYNAILMEESERSIRQRLMHNSGQCFPLIAIAQGYLDCIEANGLDPADTVLWLYRSTLACNFRLYPHHIRQILREQGQGMERAAVFTGQLSFSDISLKATMNACFRIFNRIFGEDDHEYGDDPEEILGPYRISVENTGESMDNILKIHYLKTHYPDIVLFFQASPALCCASLFTEAMREDIERLTGVPVVSVTCDGTGGSKNEVIIPNLEFPRREGGMHLAGRPADTPMA